MRIAISGILHESNTFSTLKTTWTQFSVQRGEEILQEWGKSAHEMGGFIEGAPQNSFEIHPTLMATAVPSGPVSDDAFDRLTGELIERLAAAPALDGLLLALHGAMVVESHPDGDAAIVRRLRAAIGDAFPIVVTHDFHGNIPPDIVSRSTALLTYKTCPHVDQRERGVKAANLAARIARGEVKPVQALAKPAMIYNILYQNTNREPLRPLVDETRRLEQDVRILAASVAGGYQYADVSDAGPSVVVVTDNDLELARREARRLAGLMWDTRGQLVLDLPSAAAAVREAMTSDSAPVVLVDLGDNIGGGSAGDGTALLSELLNQRSQGWVVVVADPEAVRAAAQIGVGGRYERLVGAKTDRLHGDPVGIGGRVKALLDGTYVEAETRHGGQRYFDQGLTAVIEVDGGTRDLANLLVLTTQRQPPFSLQQLISCGVHPERQKILVVKAAVAFRAAYEPVAGRIIEVDTPGATAVNPANFTWRHIRRPLFGLDPM